MPWLLWYHRIYMSCPIKTILRVHIEQIPADPYHHPQKGGIHILSLICVNLVKWHMIGRPQYLIGWTEIKHSLRKKLSAEYPQPCISLMWTFHWMMNSLITIFGLNTKKTHTFTMHTSLRLVRHGCLIQSTYILVYSPVLRCILGSHNFTHNVPILNLIKWSYSRKGCGNPIRMLLSGTIFGVVQYGRFNVCESRRYEMMSSFSRVLWINIHIVVEITICLTWNDERC